MAKLQKLAIILLVIFSFSLIVFGYAQLTDTLQIFGAANIEGKKGLYISSATPKDSNSTVNAYMDTILTSNVTLSSATSTATITITIVNASDTTKVFNAVKYIDEAYSNNNITFSLNGITSGTSVTNNPAGGGNSITFDITFAFAGKDYSNPNLTSTLLFEFADAATWEPDQPVVPDPEPDPNPDPEPNPEPDPEPDPEPEQPEVGEDYMALIIAAMSDSRGDYGLNDPHKGDVLINAIKSKKILYSTTKIQGGNIKHFASTERNTHNLDFLFEYVSDTEYVLYIWRLADVEKATIGTSEIIVFKQVYHMTGESWEKSTTMIGHAIIKNIRADGDNIKAITPSEWDTGAPHIT